MRAATLSLTERPRPARSQAALSLLVAGASWPLETSLARLIRGLGDGGATVTVACTGEPDAHWFSAPRFNWLSLQPSPRFAAVPSIGRAWMAARAILRSPSRHVAVLLAWGERGHVPDARDVSEPGTGSPHRRAPLGRHLLSDPEGGVRTSAPLRGFGCAVPSSAPSMARVARATWCRGSVSRAAFLDLHEGDPRSLRVGLRHATAHRGGRGP